MGDASCSSQVDNESPHKEKKMNTDGHERSHNKEKIMPRQMAEKGERVKRSLTIRLLR